MELFSNLDINLYFKFTSPSLKVNMSNASTTTSSIDILFGTMSLVSAVPGILGNVWILKMFYSEKQLLSRKMFILIALTHIATSFWSGIPFGLSRLMAREPMLFESKVFCNLSGLIFNITSRLSVFLISVLSFTRCIAIIRPMQHLRSNLIIGSIAGYSIIQLAIASIPFLRIFVSEFDPGAIGESQSIFYKFNKHYTNCVWSVDQIIPDPDTMLYVVAEYLLLFVPFFFPSIIVLASCCVCIISLIKSASNFPSSSLIRKGSEASKSPASARTCSVDLKPDGEVMAPKSDRQGRSSMLSTKYRATRTITLVTLLFVILNFPYWVILLLFFIEQNSGLEIINYRNDYVRCLFVFCTNVSPYVNAGLNPIIYLVRLKESKFSLSLNANWIRLNNLKMRSVSRLRDFVSNPLLHQ